MRQKILLFLVLMIGVSTVVQSMGYQSVDLGAGQMSYASTINAQGRILIEYFPGQLDPTTPHLGLWSSGQITDVGEILHEGGPLPGVLGSSSIAYVKYGGGVVNRFFDGTETDLPLTWVESVDEPGNIGGRLNTSAAIWNGQTVTLLSAEGSVSAIGGGYAAIRNSSGETKNVWNGIELVPFSTPWGSQARITDINSNGFAVGTANNQGFVVDLSTMSFRAIYGPGGDQVIPIAINNHGMVAGTLITGSEAFTWQDEGLFQTLGANTYAFDINDLGVVVGMATVESDIGFIETRAVMWTPNPVPEPSGVLVICLGFPLLARRLRR